MKKGLLKKPVSLKGAPAIGKLVRLRVSNKLWPVAAVLALAVVAVPILLSSSSSANNSPIAQAPVAPAVPSIQGIPAVSVTDTPSHAKLTGRSRNPFKQPGGAGSGSSSTKSGTKSEPTPSQTSSGNSSKSGSTTPSGGAGIGTGTGQTTTTTTTTAPPPPPPPELTSTESYDVAVSITGNSGDENTIGSLERLSALPSRTNPLLVELGVLQGGKRVLFAPQPGTIIRGKGTCIPGPAHCELLSIPRGAIEKLEAQTQDGTMPQALFAVTAITPHRYRTAAQADSARRVQSAFGRSLLRQTPGAAFALFPYEPGLGVIVDKRNVSVGGGS